MSIYIVVSDIFFSLYTNCDTISYTEAIRKLKSHNFENNDFLIKGQGLLPFEEDQLINISNSINPNLIKFWIKQQPASTEITHKKRSENILISPPTLNSSSIYEADLIISSLNELIIDHVTGEHIQGMILIEACRQMFIAISNLAHKKYKNEIRSYVVFNQINTDFLYFAFPLPAKVFYKLNSIEEDDIKTNISAKLWILQNDITALETKVNYTLFSPDFLRVKEIKKCNNVINNYKKQIALIE